MVRQSRLDTPGAIGVRIAQFLGVTSYLVMTLSFLGFHGKSEVEIN